MFIYGMVFRCAGILNPGPVTADLTTNVVHSSKLLINDVKPDHSLTLMFLLIFSGTLFIQLLKPTK